jgi:hypothetical protein
MRNLAWILGLVACLLFAQASLSEAVPRIGAQTLSGDSLSIPNDLRGRVNILIIGFTQRAGSNNVPWTDRFERDFAADTGCAVYQVAVLASVPALFRNLVINSIRKGVPIDRRARRLITFQDEKFWQNLVGYARPDDPYLLVLDGTGQIVGRTSGLFDEKAFEQLAIAVRVLTTR